MSTLQALCEADRMLIIGSEKCAKISDQDKEY